MLRGTDAEITYENLLVYCRKHEKHVKVLRSCFRKEKVTINYVVIDQFSTFCT